MNYPEVPTAYGLAPDSKDNIWFSEFKQDGRLERLTLRRAKSPNTLYPR